MNPLAQRQITQYATSVTDLFKLMTEGKEQEFSERVHSAGRFVFGDQKDNVPRLLRDDLLDQFSLSGVPQAERVPNNQLALIAMVDCWWKLGLNPYDHMICSTPVHPLSPLIKVFRLWLGITEYLYRQPGLLDECIHVAIHDNTFRRDDLEFTFAARGWAECVSFSDFESYRKRFTIAQDYFKPRFPEATKVGNEMLRRLVEKTSDTGDH